MNALLRTRVIVVSALLLLTAGLLIVGTPALAAPPANDDFDDAAVISTLPFTDAMNTTEATKASDDPDCYSSGATVWYVFTPASDMVVRASITATSFETTISIYGGPRGNLTSLGCVAAFWGNSLKVNLTAGTTYHLMVGHAWGGSGGVASLKVEELIAPPNDDFDTPQLVSTLPYTQTLDTSGATRAADDPDCYEAGATVWYRFTPANDMLLGATTSSSTYTPVLAVYSGSSGALTQHACVYSGDGQSLRVNVLAGTTYHLMIGAVWNGDGGTLNLTFEQLIPPPNDDFDKATPVAALPFDDALDTRGATSAADDPSCNGSSNSVWYAYAPSSNTRVTVSNAGSQYETSLSVYIGSRGSLFQIRCHYYSDPLTFDALAGETYYIMIASAWWGSGGQLELNLTGTILPPATANDDFDSAAVISALPFTSTINTSGATRAADDPNCHDSAATVWYKLSPASHTLLQVSVTSSTFPAAVSA